MTAIDQVRALCEYNAWANSHVLDAASQVADADRARELGASFGSVQGNLTHTVGAQSLWLSRWNADWKPDRPSPEASIDDLRRAYEAADRGLLAFAESLTDEALERTFDYVDTLGNAQSRVLWQAMLHVVNHGTHHRAETALLLTSLGSPPRQLDYVFYELERAGAPPRLT